jgi:ribosomal protein L27
VLISYDRRSKKNCHLEENGNVAFGDDSSTKILGKRTVKSENVKAGKVLLV